MSDEIEKKVKDYGNIMELCLIEASRITSTTLANTGVLELCRQITHDLFEAVTDEPRGAAELEVIGKLKEVADSFKKSDDELSLEGLIMTPRGPILVGRASYNEEGSESEEGPVLPKPPKTEGE